MTGIPRYGFFDVDSREFSSTGEGLGYRPRVAPIVPRLERLYAAAEKNNYPLVFTICCSGCMTGDPEKLGILRVPLSGGDDGWRSRIAEARCIYLEKKTCGDPALNSACLAYEMFRYNQNASLFFSLMPVDTWVVFGNGFDLCVGSAAAGLLERGHRVLVVGDVRISSHRGTAESEQATEERLRALSARFTALDTFLNTLG